MNILDVYNTLLKQYGMRKWWPMQNDFLPKEWEIEVGAILTQNTNWKNVEIALKNLKGNEVISREDVIRTPEKKLASLIRSSGYYNQKAKKLKMLAEFSGEMTRENLLGIWGIGKETADSILLYAYGKPLFVVDAYTRRVFSRLGLIEDNWGYDKIRTFFETSVPKDPDIYKEYHALIVEQGKNVCKTKPLCNECILNKNCDHFLSL